MMTPASGTAHDLISKIENRSAILSVLGLGYVGLPLAVEFASAGFTTYGFDLNESKIESLVKGQSYIPDIPSSQLAPLVESGKFIPSRDFSPLSGVDTVSICVPTPLRKTKDPDISYVVAASETVKKYFHRGMLIVLESTTYPGTTTEVLQPMFEADGFRCGWDFCLVFSPERIDPGNKHYGTQNTPKVVGGVTPRCTEVAVALYSQVIKTVVPVSSPACAEMVKLLENTFRSVNIALVNELALMCNALHVDTWEVIEAAGTKPFGFMKFHPGPGLGGHCIPIDPHYLLWKLKSVNSNSRFIELASEINANMPEFVVSRIVDALNARRKCLNGSRILLLGVAYKRDVNDIRESPALEIVKLLTRKGAEVEFHDPYIPSLEVDGPPPHVKLNSVGLDASYFRPELFHGSGLSAQRAEGGISLDTFDCVVVTTDHSVYDYPRIVRDAALVVDTRNATHGIGPELVSKVAKL